MKEIKEKHLCALLVEKIQSKQDLQNHVSEVYVHIEKWKYINKCYSN